MRYADMYELRAKYLANRQVRRFEKSKKINFFKNFRELRIRLQIDRYRRLSKTYPNRTSIK